VLLGQPLYVFLGRKTCGTGGGSDETGSRFVDNLRAGGLDAVSHGQAGHIIALAKHGHFLVLQHYWFLLLPDCLTA
jgi:hypothetical protein